MRDNQEGLLFPTNNSKEDSKSKQEEQKQSQAVVTALNEVATNLKSSTAATAQMTQTMQRGITVNGNSTTVTNTTATFA